MKIEKIKKYLIKIAYIVFLTLVIYNIAYVVTNVFSGKEYVAVFGFGIVVIDDNSMKPAINKNDLVVIKPINKDKIFEKDIIAYSNKSNYINIHRVEIIRNGNYITKGDNNYYYDIEEKDSDDIKGEVWFKIPLVGGMFKVFESKICTALIIVFLVIKYNTNRERIRKRHK